LKNGKILNLAAVEIISRDRAQIHASANRERVPPAAESGRPGNVVRADRALSPALLGTAAIAW
jgi:hypothetical protein